MLVLVTRQLSLYVFFDTFLHFYVYFDFLLRESLAWGPTLDSATQS